MDWLENLSDFLFDIIPWQILFGSTSVYLCVYSLTCTVLRTAETKMSKILSFLWRVCCWDGDRSSHYDVVSVVGERCHGAQQANLTLLGQSHGAQGASPRREYLNRGWNEEQELARHVGKACSRRRQHELRHKDVKQNELCVRNTEQFRITIARNERKSERHPELWSGRTWHVAGVPINTCLIKELASAFLKEKIWAYGYAYWAYFVFYFVSRNKI